jgi:hypothetical protein
MKRALEIEIRLALEWLKLFDLKQLFKKCFPFYKETK